MLLVDLWMYSVFKKGERSNPENYRPISLTCVCNKILEHIIHTNIIKHLSNHNALSDVQFGFCENRSAELQQINTTHDFALNLNNKGQTEAILLDFSKAFDKVPHRLLLHKLKHYRICGKALDQTADFLSDRTQRVVCGGYSSEPVSVTSGVPQGSMMGPLLFLMYINDITLNLSSSCRLFADDCVLYRRIDSADDPNLLQENLRRLERWEETWQTKFNISKFTVLAITLKRNPLVSEYFLHGCKLNAITEAKYLEVLLDSKLLYKHHIDATCLKANRTLAFICRNLKSCNQQVKLDAYNVFIKPILNYPAQFGLHTQDAI